MKEIAPNTRVIHISHRWSSDYDRWNGIVIRPCVPALPGGETRWEVRWIKPCGDPSDGLTIHEAWELLTEIPARGGSA